MQKKRLVWFLAPALVAATLAACSDSDKQDNPIAPTPVGDVTLKASAPTCVSPANNAEADSRTPTLVITNASGTYATVPLKYRFEVQNAAGQVFNAGVVDAGANGRTSFTLTKALEIDQAYSWTARAEYGTSVGPWSTKVNFHSPRIPEGYIRGNEVYDPLNGGRALGSVGRIIGPHTWTADGIRLDSDRSFIEYKLPQYCGRGEFSMIVSHVCGSCGTVKSKVMSMREGLGDLIPNRHRMTVEKRADGNVAWRFITNGDQVDTIGGERTNPGIRESQTNLWKATWNGTFTVTIQRLPGFQTFYQMGKPYHGSYDPNPHYAYVGSPMGGSHGTVPGMVVRQVWLSPNPRPDWANE